MLLRLRFAFGAGAGAEGASCPGCVGAGVCCPRSVSPAAAGCGISLRRIFAIMILPAWFCMLLHYTTKFRKKQVEFAGLWLSSGLEGKAKKSQSERTVQIGSAVAIENYSRISMPSLNLRLPRIFLTKRSTSSGVRGLSAGWKNRLNAMLFLSAPSFSPR